MIVCNGILFFIGVVIFFTQKVKITSQRLVIGTRARIVGILLMLPIPLSLLIRPLVDDDYPYLWEIDILIFFVCLLVAVIVGLSDPDRNTRMYHQLPPVLTPMEAAQYLKVSEAEIRRLIADNRLHATQIGKDYRIARESLDTLFR